MKTKILSLALMLISVIAFGSNEQAGDITGNSMTSLGDYSITHSEKAIVIDGMSFETYSLNYKNAERPILIGIESRKNCKNFIVKGPNFEVEYVCKKGKMGAKQISAVYREINETVNNVVIDSKQLEAQKIISNSVKSDDELLGMIACYLPMLIKEDFRDQI